MSTAAIAQIETGRRKDVRLSTLSALARALNVTVDHLVSGDTSGPTATLEHRALFYASDEQLIDAIAPFLLEGLERAEAAVAVTTRSRLDLLREALGSRSRDVQLVDSATWYVDPKITLRAYQRVIATLQAAGAPWIRVIGEPVWTGLSESEIRTWIRYESILNLTLASAPATIVCPYDTRALPASIVASARRTHPELAEPDGPVASAPYEAPEDVLLAPEDG